MAEAAAEVEGIAEVASGDGGTIDMIGGGIDSYLGYGQRGSFLVV
mgnify:CR=1 FL=1